MAPGEVSRRADGGGKSLSGVVGRLDVTHTSGVIDLSGSTLNSPAAGSLELLFRGAYPPGTIVLRDGVP